MYKEVFPLRTIFHFHCVYFVKGEEGYRENIHRDLRVMAQEMSFKEGCKVIDVHEALKRHVKDVLFYGKTLPPLTNRKYYPAKHDIRNLRLRVHQLCQFTESEQTVLTEVVEKLKGGEQHPNILFHMKVVGNETENNPDPDDDDLFFQPEQPKKKPRYERKTPKKAPKGHHAFMFACQSSWQQWMLQKYGTTVFIAEVRPNASATRALTFSIYVMMVQTNVDYQVVGCLLYSKIHKAFSLGDCLQHIASTNLQWASKYFVVDVGDEISTALEAVFPGE